MSAWRVAKIVLGGRYTDKRMFIVDTGKDGGGAYVRLWELGATKNARQHLLDR